MLTNLVHYRHVGSATQIRIYLKVQLLEGTPLFSISNLVSYFGNAVAPLESHMPQVPADITNSSFPAPLRLPFRAARNVSCSKA